ncbi:hypothetical protein KL929_001566 [Ogataea haglerorum]|uniref:uncharacterized protein n=1 Tax=Ogataea haglerorum TaxID=1937702 RepID=UPI001C8AC448|nr:uncharacterized protein KL911_000343 [Ogataea haglerorum]KAG7700763.1 hypothetical protein KL951_000878 [Ogataea haglerorum]KAG7720314.1 hypothetical protein KL913_001214 [Ogataea haglerorum]KAG7720700.1 hypothetical protein KL949_001572 [Ogataea haglerorum]KAG7748312.1 hypothetical protein KL912_002217 [Ogataea haglerorum]KAG7759206.1 hypothetical protein KL911_000343 [Ogataea haglerorum]
MNTRTNPEISNNVRSSKKGDSAAGFDLTRAACILIAGQTTIKFMTFAMNQMLIQHVTPTGLGLCSLIEFVINTVLFISREPVRLSVQAMNTELKEYDQLLVNFSYLPLVFCAIIAGPFVHWQLGFGSLFLSSWHYQVCLVAIIASLVLEILSEPYYNANQTQLNVTKRAKIESFASFVKCVVQFTIVMNVRMKAGKDATFVVAYILAQFFYSLTVFVCYSRFRLALPRLSSTGAFLEPLTWNYLRSLFLQQIFKHFLTEGDRFVLNQFFPIVDQGYYSIVLNYGSLMARLLFQPVEETIRMNTAKLFASNQPETCKRANLNRNIYKVVTVYIYILTLLLIFAPRNTSFFIHQAFPNIADPEKFVEVFKIYWYYLPLLSMNGVLEALFNSVYTDPDHVSLYSRLMFVNSACFYLTSAFFIKRLQLGLVGLILANSINMLIRILFCAFEVKPFLNFKDQNYTKFLYFWAFCAVIVAIQNKIVAGDTVTAIQFGQDFGLGLIALAFIVIIESKIYRLAYDLLANPSATVRTTVAEIIPRSETFLMKHVPTGQ